MSAKAIVHVVDDDESLRSAVTRLLEVAGYEVRGYASAGDFLLADSSPVPGCLLLDVRMPGPSGLELQEALAKRPNPLPIVILTGHGDIPMSVRAIKGGAVDFLTKPVQKEHLLAAVATAIERSQKAQATRALLQVLGTRFAALTDRERAVFDGVVEGKLNKQIAMELGLAERTVKAHRAQVMRKMQASSLAELVRIAEQLQLLATSQAPGSPET